MNLISSVSTYSLYYDTLSFVCLFVVAMGLMFSLVAGTSAQLDFICKRVLHLRLGFTGD